MKRIHHEQASMFISGASVRVDKQLIPLLTLFNKLYGIRTVQSCVDANGRGYIAFTSDNWQMVRTVALRLKAELELRLETSITFNRTMKEHLAYLHRYEICAWPTEFLLLLRHELKFGYIHWPREEYELFFDVVESLVSDEISQLAQTLA